MKYAMTTVIVGLAVAWSVAGAADLSQHNSRAALMGRPRVVTVAVMPAGGVASEHGSVPVEVTAYSSRAALIGRGKEVTIAVSPATAPVPGHGTPAVATERYSTRNAVLGR